jgi:hypothetical protein
MLNFWLLNGAAAVMIIFHSIIRKLSGEYERILKEADMAHFEEALPKRFPRGN